MYILIPTDDSTDRCYVLHCDVLHPHHKVSSQHPKLTSYYPNREHLGKLNPPLRRLTHYQTVLKHDNVYK